MVIFRAHAHYMRFWPTLHSPIASLFAFTTSASAEQRPGSVPSLHEMLSCRQKNSHPLLTSQPVRAHFWPFTHPPPSLSINQTCSRTPPPPHPSLGISIANALVEQGSPFHLRHPALAPRNEATLRSCSGTHALNRGSGNDQI